MDTKDKRKLVGLIAKLIELSDEEFDEFEQHARANSGGKTILLAALIHKAREE